MKKDFDYEEETNQEEMSSVLVKIIPFVLIIVILAVTLLVNTVNSRQDEKEVTVSEDILPEVTTAPLKEQNKESVPPASAPDQEPSTTKESESPDPTPYQEIMETTDLSKVKFDAQTQLAEMMYYWEDGNQEALDDLANLDRFKAMSWHLSGTEDFYYYGDTNAGGKPHGKGIAVYADNQYYCGDWADGKRSGAGTWIHYHIHIRPSKTDIYVYHQYAGTWKNDLPDGEGFEHYDFNIELLKDYQYYNTNLIGSYSEGMIDGEFYITTIERNETIREWEAEANHGSWVYQSDSVDPKGERTIYIGAHDPDAYIWMHPKKNHDIGVPCMISPNRPQS